MPDLAARMATYGARVLAHTGHQATCVVIHPADPAGHADGAGGWVAVPETQEPACPCTYIPGRTVEGRAADGTQIVGRSAGQVILPRSVPVAETDQLRVSRPGLADMTVEISSVGAVRDDWWRIVEVADLASAG